MAKPVAARGTTTPRRTIPRYSQSGMRSWRSFTAVAAAASAMTMETMIPESPTGAVLVSSATNEPWQLAAPGL